MLHVHRAERADALVGALGALLARPLPDPFAREVVAVPTRGIERWVAQRLSGGLGASPGRADGVCANVDFPTWRRLVARVPGPDPARRIEHAGARLREQPELVDLPARFSLFGLTRLPTGRLEVLRALAAARDVHLFLLHPSPALWEAVRAAA